MKSRTSTVSRHGPSVKPSHAGTWAESVLGAPSARTPLVVPGASETLVIWTSLVPDARVRAQAGTAGPARPRVEALGRGPAGSFATSRLGSRGPARTGSGTSEDLGPEAGETHRDRLDPAAPGRFVTSRRRSL